MSRHRSAERESRRISLLLGLLFGLASMGTSSAAVALPMMAAELDVSLGNAAWAISVYVLSLAVTTAVYGRVSDLVGVRGPLLFGVTLMTAGAVVAALAPSYAVLVVARVFQGAGAAAVPTLGVTVLSARYDGVVRGLAFGRLAAMTAALSCAGPLVGGVVEELAGWRAVMALPILGVLVVPFVWHVLAGEGTGARLDVVGAVLVALTSAGLVLLVQSPTSGIVVALCGAALLALGTPLVARRVRRHPHGFLPRSVVSNGAVVRSAVAASAVPASWFAMLIGVPAVMVAEGWAAWEVGLLLVPSAGVAFLVPRWAGPVLERRGGPWALALSGVVASGALLLCALGLALVWPVPVALAVALTTLSFGLAQPALMASVGDAVDLDVRGVALGIATLLFLVGGSVGSAMVAALGELIGIPATVAVMAALPVLGLLALAPAPRAGRAVRGPDRGVTSSAN